MGNFEQQVEGSKVTVETKELIQKQMGEKIRDALKAVGSLIKLGTLAGFLGPEDLKEIRKNLQEVGLGEKDNS